jgi:hypothetical protein
MPTTENTMNRYLSLAMLPLLAACASTGDYPGAAPVRPLPAAPAARLAAPPLEMPAEPFIVTAPGPAGPATPYHVTPTPMGPIVTPGVVTHGGYGPNGAYKPLQPLN